MPKDYPEYVPVTLEKHIAKSKLLTFEECQETAAKWAQKLCLTNWAIDIRFGNANQMDGALGHCNWKYSRLRATISLLDPKFHDENDSWIDPIDMEHVIVHELLHIHFSAWHEWVDEDARQKMGNIDQCVCEEHPIERLAWVLVNMRRDVIMEKKMEMSWENK